MKPSFFKIIIYSVLLTPVFSNAQIIESDFGSSKNVDQFGPEEIEKPTTANHFTLPKDTIIYSTRILFDNNQSVWSLEQEGRMVEKIEIDESIVYLKTRSPSNDRMTNEYHRVNDSTYYYKLKDGIKTLNQGLLTARLIPDIRPDTVVTFDPETYAEDVYILSPMQLIKTGNWIETDSLQFRSAGRYLNGERDGFWRTTSAASEQPVISANYEKGGIVGIYNPSRAQFEQYATWFTEPQWLFCRDDQYVSGDQLLHRNLSLVVTGDGGCLNLGIFIFGADGAMYYSPQKINKFTPGSGVWTFSDKNGLEITFANKEKHHFKVNYLGKKLITLEEKQ